MSVSKMNLQPDLEDDLIILRPLAKSDYDTLFEVAQDPLIWVQHQIKNRYQNDVFRNFFKDSLKSKGALVSIDKQSNTMIGSSRYNLIDGVDQDIEIGWSFLARNHWGGLYNLSMKTLMIDHAFKYISNIVFYIDVNNIRSQKAVEKIGGKRIIGNQLKELIKKSESDWTYVITKEEWNRRSKKL
jgi:RimJ/RimL family protein N-acetyltransferase